MAKIDRLFDAMLDRKASDLHLAEGLHPKCRIHGSIVHLDGFPELTRESIREMLREICLPEKWEAYERRGDMDFAYSYEGKARFRCNFMKQYSGYGAVFRTIPSKILSLEEINAPAVLKTFAHFNSGLCLVTGPTGSGKSTTLAAVIDSINTTQSRVVLTIEEPIEFVHSFKKSTVIQREVGLDVPSFGDALTVSSRQDADVVLVGEMRDLETIALAMTASEMGTLVFGTLHTNSATKTVYRIVDVFPASEQKGVRDSLAVSLKAVCAQLLMKRKDKSGRIPVHEVFIQTRASANIIREGAVGQLMQVIMSGRALGMQLMDDSIERLFNEGIIDGEEAYGKAIDKHRFEKFAPIAD